MNFLGVAALVLVLYLLLKNKDSVSKNKDLLVKNKSILMHGGLALIAAIVAHFQANKAWVGWENFKKDLAKRLEENNKK